MHRISAGLATCLVAAVTVGCGTAQAGQPGSQGHTNAPATAGSPGQQPGSRLASGCQGGVPAGPGGPDPRHHAGRQRENLLRTGRRQTESRPAQYRYQLVAAAAGQQQRAGPDSRRCEFPGQGTHCRLVRRRPAWAGVRDIGQAAVPRHDLSRERRSSAGGPGTCGLSAPVLRAGTPLQRLDHSGALSDWFHVAR